MYYIYTYIYYNIYIYYIYALYILYVFIVHIYTIYILYISPFEFKLQDGRPCASYKALRFSQANSDIESMFNNVQDFGRLNL